MLATLPPELIKALGETTLVLNQEAILAVIERIAAQNPQTAIKLKALVENFEIERIRELLDKVG